MAIVFAGVPVIRDSIAIHTAIADLKDESARVSVTSTLARFGERAKSAAPALEEVIRNEITMEIEHQERREAHPLVDFSDSMLMTTDIDTGEQMFGPVAFMMFALNRIAPDAARQMRSELLVKLKTENFGELFKSSLESGIDLVTP